MIARLGWIGALAGLALVTSFAQIDRSARFDPQFAPLVPTMLRGFAQQTLAEIALSQGDAASALPLARQLVRERPLPAENLRILSQAALLSGNEAQGIAALEAAGGRGWREPVSQTAMARAALLAQDWDAASQRIVALLATSGIEREQLNALVIELTQPADGRAAMARRLAEQGHWQSNFVRLAPAYLSPAIYADLIARSQEAGAPPS